MEIFVENIKKSLPNLKILKIKDIIDYDDRDNVLEQLKDLDIHFESDYED